jgi:hypothetical protein
VAQVLSRWYSPEASLLLPAREVDTRRHAVVRTIIIVPSVIAAIPVAVVAGDVSLFPAWFLCISFLVCLGLAVLFIITGYFKVPVATTTCADVILHSCAVLG